MAAAKPGDARVLITMGVSGCGKSTFGRELARRLGVPFLDGDAFHPPENVAKMRAGIALDDADRWPWLDRLSGPLRAAALAHGLAVGSCSALKRSYRDRLRERIGLPTTFIHLQAPREELAKRMVSRPGHYMPVSLLDSQLQTLQPPEEGERACILDATQPLEALLARVSSALGLPMAAAPSSDP